MASMRAAPSLGLLVALSACPYVPTQQAPAAQTPQLVSVAHPGSPPASVSLAAGHYYAMPDDAVLVTVNAPWPTTLAVAIDGEVLEKTDSRTRIDQLAAQGKGAFRTLAIKPSGSTFEWDLSIIPAPAKAAGSGFTISLTDGSINPNTTGAAREAPPLLLPIGSVLFGAVSNTPFKPSDGFCGNLPINPGDPCKPGERVPDGKVVQGVELRGWVTNRPGFDDTFHDDPNNPPEERTFNVLLDWGWTPDPLAIASGVHALNTLAAVDQAFTPQNVIRFGVGADRVGEEANHHTQLTPDGLVWGGPGGMVVHVEIDGWFSGGRKAGQPAPAGWLQSSQGDGRTRWSFDPVAPPSWPAGHALAVGDYVRVVGTLWEDHPHVDHGAGPDAGRCWFSGFTGHRGWHEVHAVDYLALLPPPAAHADTLETIAICGERSFTRDVVPPGPRPSPGSSVGCEEQVDGDFTVLRSVGMGSNTGSQSCTGLADRARIEVTTKATSDHGAKFKATYRVFWR